MAAPERIDLGGELVLRRCHPADAEALYLAIVESREHLLPWTPWVTRASLEEERAVLVRWEEQWDAGGELQYGLFVGPLAVGSTALIPRIGPGGLEIGYWVHAAHTRRGYATSSAAALAWPRRVCAACTQYPISSPSGPMRRWSPTEPTATGPRKSP